MTAPIVGATKLRHVEDALAAAELTLDGEQVARLERASGPSRSHGGAAWGRV